jgi:DNA-binding CsgD family transcriptional regulator
MHTEFMSALADVPGFPLAPRQAAQLLAADTQAALAEALLEVAQNVAAIEEVFAYRIVPGKAPETLLSCGAGEGAKERARAYGARYHALDPVGSMRSVAARQGAFGRHVLASEISQPDYRGICFERPRFVDKLCFGWRGDTDVTVVSFYRRQTDARPLAALSALAWLALGQVGHLLRADKDEVVIRLEARLCKAYPQLTRRELQVCARTLAGWSAERIARDLEMRRSSVLTYRQRAYRRTDVSAAAEMISGVIGNG